MKLSKLIDKCVALSEDGDFHLEHLYNKWAASCCYIKPVKLLSKRGDKNPIEAKWHNNSWFRGKTAEEAVSKLLKQLQGK